MVGCPGVTVLGSKFDFVWWSYIDDFGVLARHPEIANTVVQIGVDALTSHGFIENQKKRTQATHDSTTTQVLGGEILREGKVVPSAAKMAQLLRVTTKIIEDRSTTPHTLSQVVGSWVWFLLLNRPLLSILQHVYDFTSKEPEGDIVEMSGQALLELTHLTNLAPLLYIDMARASWSLVSASDASMHGLGASFTGIPANFDPFLASEKIGWTSRHDSNVDAHVEMHPLTVAITNNLSAWSDIFAIKLQPGWHHIVLLEGEAAVQALLFYLKFQTQIWRKRALFYVDSTSFLGAAAKGRSSSRVLNGICRRLAAIQSAAHVHILWAWVATNRNPADRPSRSLES